MPHAQVHRDRQGHAHLGHSEERQPGTNTMKSYLLKPKGLILSMAVI